MLKPECSQRPWMDFILWFLYTPSSAPIPRQSGWCCQHKLAGGNSPWLQLGQLNQAPTILASVIFSWALARHSICLCPRKVVVTGFHSSLVSLLTRTAEYQQAFVCDCKQLFSNRILPKWNIKSQQQTCKTSQDLSCEYNHYLYSVFFFFTSYEYRSQLDCYISWIVTMAALLHWFYHFELIP